MSEPLDFEQFCKRFGYEYCTDGAKDMTEALEAYLKYQCVSGSIMPAYPPTMAENLLAAEGKLDLYKINPWYQPGDPRRYGAQPIPPELGPLPG